MKIAQLNYSSIQPDRESESLNQADSSNQQRKSLKLWDLLRSSQIKSLLKELRVSKTIQRDKYLKRQFDQELFHRLGQDHMECNLLHSFS